MRVIPWRLPYNRGKSTEKSQSGLYRTTQQFWKSAGRAPSLRVIYTLAFALQLRKKHGKTSVRVAEECQLLVYVFLLLCMFRSGYFISLCCSVYCLYVNVYCTIFKFNIHGTVHRSMTSSNNQRDAA